MTLIKFDNRILRTPQAASKVEVGVAAKGSPDSTGRVLVIGESEGGIINQINWFDSPITAKETLRSGDTLRSIGYIFDPSSQRPGAEKVGFIRAQATTQGALDLGSLSFKSIDYGTWVNAIKIKTEAATQDAGDNTKITIDYAGNQEIGDNLGLALTIQSTTSESDAKIEVTAGDHIIGTDGATGVENTIFDFDFSDTNYNTVDKVVAAINALSTWTCSVYSFAPNGVGGLNSTVLNTLSATSCKVSAVNLKAFPFIVKQFIDSISTFVTATVETDGTKITANDALTPLTGGTAPAMDTTAVSDALTLAEPSNIRTIFIQSESASVHAQVDAHCGLRTLKSPRVGVFGGTNQTTLALSISDTSSRAVNLNSARSILVACGITDFKLDGSGTEALPPVFFAAKIAGLRAGLPLQEPMTFKTFRCQGLQYDYTITNTDTFIGAGVLAPVFEDGIGFIVAAGVNTLQDNVQLWSASADASPEDSLERIKDEINFNIERAAERIFIGGNVGIGRETIIDFVETILNQAVDDGWLAEDDSDPDDIKPAWEGVDAVRLSDGWHASWAGRGNNPFNFFLTSGTILG